VQLGLLGKIKDVFSNNTVEDEEFYENDEAWSEEKTIKRDDVDMDDDTQRENYVSACLEQMAEASRELDTLNGEYNLVTTYLTDMEEIEAEPEEIQTRIKALATKLADTEADKEKFEKKRLIMTQAEYSQMQRVEQYMPEGYSRLKEAEDYQVMVKKDLARLDGEMQAYHYRKSELITSQKNMKIVTTICVGAMLFLIVLLAVMSVLWNLDVTIGYAIAIVIAASSLAIVYVKFHDSQKELVKVEKSINKLVLLQNTVKIKYVNNTNLLEYLYVKYDVNSSNELKKLWDKYIEENKQREHEKKLQEDMDINEAALVKFLRGLKIAEPSIWVHQAYALLDSKEMVEIRHNLILRRQKLRKQMEYNAKMAQQAQDEVKDIVNTYPEYAKNILDLVNNYEKALA
jgi:hypothetical protein